MLEGEADELKVQYWYSKIYPFRFWLF
jgi:hypothetical protein